MLYKQLSICCKPFECFMPMRAPKGSLRAFPTYIPFFQSFTYYPIKCLPLSCQSLKYVWQLYYSLFRQDNLHVTLWKVNMLLILIKRTLDVIGKCIDSLIRFFWITKCTKEFMNNGLWYPLGFRLVESIIWPSNVEIHVHHQASRILFPLVDSNFFYYAWYYNYSIK